MRKEKGGKRGRKKMDEREKESEVEEIHVSTTGPEERLSGQKYLQFQFQFNFYSA